MKLNEPFDRKLLSQQTKGNKTFDYIPVSEVIARLNEVLGHDGWSYSIDDRWAYGDQGGYPVWVCAQVSLMIHDGDKRPSKDAIGGQQVEFFKDPTKGPLDMGNSWKGAVSDALKKAAQAFGVGLELARSSEALAFQSPEVDWIGLGWASQQAHDEAWDALKVRAGFLPDDKKAQLKAWWADNKQASPFTADFIADYTKQIDTLEAGKTLDVKQQYTEEQQAAF